MSEQAGINQKGSENNKFEDDLQEQIVEEQVIVDGAIVDPLEDYDYFNDEYMDDETGAFQEGEDETGNQLGMRANKSLVLLTQRFINFLHSTPAGLVDLNMLQAADSLNVTAKRRLYDITNVLEGVGLIEKRSKNVIYWRGGKFRRPGGTVEVLPGEEQRMYKLKSDLTELEREERLIDTHLLWMKQSIRNICEERDNFKLGYNVHDDFLRVFPDNKAVVIQAPPNTSVEINTVGVGRISNYPDDTRYELKLKSFCGPAQAIPIPSESTTEPNVFESLKPPATEHDYIHMTSDADKQNVSSQLWDFVHFDEENTQIKKSSKPPQPQAKTTNIRTKQNLSEERVSYKMGQQQHSADPMADDLLMEEGEEEVDNEDIIVH